MSKPRGYGLCTQDIARGIATRGLCYLHTSTLDSGMARHGCFEKAVYSYSILIILYNVKKDSEFEKNIVKSEYARYQDSKW